MRKALEEFYAISVREASMIQMLEQLNFADFNSNCSRSNTPFEKRKIIFKG